MGVGEVLTVYRIPSILCRYDYTEISKKYPVHASVADVQDIGRSDPHLIKT